MKTWKQKYDEDYTAWLATRKAYENLWEEHSALIKKSLRDTNIDGSEINMLRNIIDILEDIRKNGGGYSSAKACEILYMLGELK